MMPSYEPAPHKRYEPPRAFVKIILNSPASKQTYRVRHGPHGEPFDAFLSEDRRWYRVLPDADGDGTRELGPMIGLTLNLEYETALTPSVRL